jgi:hypothetical protein
MMVTDAGGAGSFAPGSLTTGDGVGCGSFSAWDPTTEITVSEITASENAKMMNQRVPRMRAPFPIECRRL